ncbi:MAG TPA: hypothetical protein VMW75_03660 [Thermoanaerobaculia bacterium]|nr:hypothetical protein [Thermoanaerobaculia bacterium]
MAKKADIAAKLNLAVAEVAKHKAELSKTSAELLRKDQAGALPIRSVARW